MSVSRLTAILFIFCCCTFAWFVLGVSVGHRTGEYNYMLEAEVMQLWGGRHVQRAPQAWIQVIEERTETIEEKNEEGETVTRHITKDVERWQPVALATSDVDVTLQLEHRRKGLLWYDLYEIDFDAAYTLIAPEVVEGPLRVTFTFPSPEAIYDGFTLRVADQEGSADDLQSAVAVVVDGIVAGQEVPVEIGYRSRGLDTWTYAFREQGVGQVRDFNLTMMTDFTEVDFPAGTISPTDRGELGGADPAELIVWRFDSLVTGKRIGVDLPNRLNPGPLTQRVTFFAPVSLLFFLTVMVILGITLDRNLHPMHYFFLSTAFFSFHLLLAYLVDHISVHLAFVISAVVSMFLVISYLRVVGGTHFAVSQAGLAQLVYLVLFNYAFFFQGFTGLTITVGAIVTLFALMQLTAKVDWEQSFVGTRAHAAASSAG
jgi:hypothetical protein